MTPSQKILAVREAINKACPWLLELKAGCVVTFDMGGYAYGDFILTGENRNYSAMYQNEKQKYYNAVFMDGTIKFNPIPEKCIAKYSAHHHALQM